MASQKLTTATIKSLKPQEKEYRVSDGKQLFLVVKPNGRATRGSGKKASGHPFPQ
jgi:hypothetical protein